MWLLLVSELVRIICGPFCKVLSVKLGEIVNKGRKEEGYMSYPLTQILEILCYLFHYLGKKVFETVLSSQGLKGQKA